MLKGSENNFKKKKLLNKAESECDNVPFNITNRASDRVRQKMENSAAFSREIMRQERPIMRQIM